MKKKFIFFPLFGALLYVLLSSYSAGPGLSLLERTGATGTAGCAGGGCHGSAAGVAVTMQLMSGSTPVTTYTPGTSYTIRITGVFTTSSSTTILPKFGYQVAAVKTAATSTNAGTMTAPSGSHLATPSINVVEHSSALSATTGTGGTGTTYVVNIPWTAPVAGTGSVTLYGVINAVNGTGGADAVDRWANNSAVITEATSTTVAPITGALSVCIGATTTLADATTGGAWTSGSTGIATVSAAGVVTGIAAGTATISYNAGTAGTATAVVTVNANPPAITGTATLCAGTTTNLTNATPGGTWTSSATGIATVNASGTVTGVAAGNAPITYTLSTGCYTTIIATVTPGIPAITGTATVCTGAATTLANTVAGGTWSSSTTAVATVNTTGVVSGVTAGTATITYSVTGGCYATAIVTVNSSTAGTITGPVTVCVGRGMNLASTVSGGSWSSTNVAKATVNATTGHVTGVATGLDTIKYTVTNSCGTATTLYPITVLSTSACPVGVAAVAAQVMGLTAYPNPAYSGAFTANLTTENTEAATITITNLTGRVISVITGSTNKEINIRLNVPAGLYLITATTEHERYVSKIVIE